MKKKTIYTMLFIAVLAFMASSVAFACDGANAENASAKASCSAKGTDAKLTSGKAACSAKGFDAKLTSSKAACSAKGTDAKLTSSGKACTPEQIAACAKMIGMSKEECANLCDSKGTMTAFEVKGMTCNGCETALTTALSKVDGVFHVASVSYKNEQAIICYDKDKVNTDAFIKAITDKGYTAQVIPAVATSVDGKTQLANGKKACCAKSGSTTSVSASCSAKKDADNSKGSL